MSAGGERARRRLKVRDPDEPSPEPEHPDESTFWQNFLSRTAQERFEEESMDYYENRRLDLWRASQTMVAKFWKFFGELIVFSILYWVFYFVHYAANHFDYVWCLNPHTLKTDYCEVIDWVKKYCPQQREMFKQAMGAFLYNKIGMFIDFMKGGATQRP
jgi:hypothetical protein